MLEILFFVGLAVFVLFKLYSSLGNHTDDDKTLGNRFASRWTEQTTKPTEQKKALEADIVIHSGFEANLPQYIREVFDNIRLHDHTFDSKIFVENAKQAFKIITKAIDEDKKDFLSRLVDKDVYNIIATEIDQMRSQGHACERQILDFLPESGIENASIRERDAIIAVRFVTEQKITIRDLAGNIIEEGTKPVVRNEVWVFKKALSSKEQIWFLISK